MLSSPYFWRFVDIHKHGHILHSNITDDRSQHNFYQRLRVDMKSHKEDQKNLVYKLCEYICLLNSLDNFFTHIF